MPAMMNQYGEMCTGMPKGRPTTIPAPGCRRAGWSCGGWGWLPWLFATP